MTDEEWQGIALLLDKAWKGSFGAGEDRAYRLLLDTFSAEQVVGALQVLVARGGPFLPAAAEIVAEIRHDPGRPTFQEMFQSIYGPRGVLMAREPYRGPVLDPGASRERAAAARLAECHPLVVAFVRTQGLGRLRMLEVDHPDYGEVRRKELARDWDDFLEANEGREVAALVAGRRGELGQFDPLRALQPALLTPAEPQGATT